MKERSWCADAEEHNVVLWVKYDGWCGHAVKVWEAAFPRAVWQRAFEYAETRTDVTVWCQVLSEDGSF